MCVLLPSSVSYKSMKDTAVPFEYILKLSPILKLELIVGCCVNVLLPAMLCDVVKSTPPICEADSVRVDADSITPSVYPNEASTVAPVVTTSVSVPIVGLYA